MEFGHTLRRLREERGLSLRALGARTHYSHGYLHDLEHDRKSATVALATRLDEALEADGELIAIVSPPPATPDIAMLHTARERYERMYRQVGGAAIRSRVARFYNTRAAPLLSNQYDEPTGRALYRAAGRLSAITGICAGDSNAQMQAQHYFGEALRLARASGDARLSAYVLVLMTNQAFLDRDYQQAVTIAEAGLRAANRHLTPALRTDLYLTEAKAYAGAGISSDSRRCMVLAERAAARIRKNEEPPEASYVQPGLVELQLAEALAYLDDLGPAREYAAYAARTPAHPRGNVQRLATLARVDLRSGQVEQAAASAVEMVEAAAGMESHQLTRRFRGIRDQLATVDTPTVVDAIEHVDGWLSVPL